MRAPCRCKAELAPGPKQPARPWRWAARIFGTGALAAGVLIAALPSIMSTRWGLSSSLAVINALAPGQVEVTSVQMGWTSPINIEGLQFKDKASRQAVPLVQVQKISSSSGLWQLLRAARMRPSPSGPSDADASPSRTSSDASSISSISSTSSNGSAAGSDAWQTHLVVIQGARFNCEYDPELRKFKLIDWLENAHLLSSDKAQQLPPASLPQLPGLSVTGAATTDASVDATATGDSATPGAGRSGANRGASMNAGMDAKQHGRAIEMLCHANATMAFSADLRMGRGLQLMLPDAYLRVPREARDMLGSHLHVTGALGAAALNDWALETDEDVSWARSDREPFGSATSFNPMLSSDSEDAASMDMASTRYPLPRGYQPGTFQLHSDHLRAEMRVYTAERGSGPILLPEPASATLECTPALSRFGLSMFNPLLANAVAVQGPARAVRMYFAPEGMQLPYSGAMILVQPMKLALAGGGLLEDLCRAAHLSPELARQKVLQLETSGMQVHIASQGPIATNRVDMSVGLPSGTRSLLELSLWGYHDPGTGKLDMVLGLPTGVLQQLAIGEMPEGYLLPVQLKGTVDRPEVGYDSLVRRLGALMLRQQYLGAKQQQERLRAQVQGRTGASTSLGGGLVTQALGAVANLQLPDVKVVREAEAQVEQDLKRIPQPWSLPVPAWAKQ